MVGSLIGGGLSPGTATLGHGPFILGPLPVRGRGGETVDRQQLQQMLDEQEDVELAGRSSGRSENLK